MAKRQRNSPLSFDSLIRRVKQVCVSIARYRRCGCSVFRGSEFRGEKTKRKSLRLFEQVSIRRNVLSCDGLRVFHLVAVVVATQVHTLALIVDDVEVQMHVARALRGNDTPGGILDRVFRFHDSEARPLLQALRSGS